MVELLMFIILGSSKLYADHAHEVRIEELKTKCTVAAKSKNGIGIVTIDKNCVFIKKERINEMERDTKIYQ